MGTVCWKQIPDFPLYVCSPSGTIKNRKRDKVLRPTKDKNGYKRILLCRNGYHKNIAVHRVVALTFLDNPNNLPQVNHIDGNKINNNVSNLEWCSNYNNIHHAINNGLIKVKNENNPNAKLKKKDVIAIREWFASGRYNKSELARAFGVSRTLIRYIIQQKIWRYDNEDL